MPGVWCYLPVPEFLSGIPSQQFWNSSWISTLRMEILPDFRLRLSENLKDSRKNWLKVISFSRACAWRWTPDPNGPQNPPKMDRKIMKESINKNMKISCSIWTENDGVCSKTHRKIRKFLRNSRRNPAAHWTLERQSCAVSRSTGPQRHGGDSSRGPFRYIHT